MTSRVRVRLVLAVAGLCVFGVLGVFVSAALADEPAAQWTVTAVSRATNFRPGDETGDDSYRVTVTNTGSAASDGEPVAVTDELPEGLSLDLAGASGEDPLARANGGNPSAGFSCLFRTCTYTGVVAVDETLTFVFPVDVGASPPPSCAVPAGAVSCVTNVVRVAGAGAPEASVSTPTVISDAPASFGIALGGASTVLSSTQAGAHPDLTTAIAFDTVDPQGALAGDPKDTIDDLPPGFTGDLVDTPACPTATLTKRECPVPTQVGIITIVITPLSKGARADTFIEPVYNVAPNPGETAKLGFSVGGIFAVQGNVVVRPSDYGLQTTFENVDEAPAEIDSVSLTVWGVPAAAVHDPLRWNGGKADEEGHFGASSSAVRAPFFTSPTACTSAPLQAEFTLTSWEHPAETTAPTGMPFGPIVGCDRLGMQPSLSAQATSDSAYAPTGLDVATRIPQTYENPEGLATSTLKKEVVTLPEGMTVNPSSGAGLQACSEAQYAEEEPQPKTAQQTAEGHGCPGPSKLATVKIKTPSLSDEITGSVYLATPAPRGEPGQNPFGSLLAVYLIARDANRGVLIKAPGEIKANEITGRLTTTFDDLPPLPFSLATFQFNQGANAPLVTPPACGNYTVTAELTPWSNPEGSPLTPEIPPFPITTSCPPGGTPPFTPQLAAGTLNNAAGAYSPLDIRLSRNDGEQEITGFSSQMPPGLTANLTGVAQCGEAEIAAAAAQTGAEAQASPACPAGSEIGYTIAEAGVGTVLAQTPGKLYLGAAYQGAPFSIVSVTAAKVGPFDLGTVVVHLPLFINPETAAVTVGSGTSNQIPHIIKGIVIHLRNIHVYVDRAHFILNPTSCGTMSLSATVIGGGADPTNPADNTPATVVDPFQAADCSSLAFGPAFSVATSAKASRATGASLTFRVAYPPNPVGSQAWFNEARFEIPKQLPARLTTIQKACLASTFEHDRSACPAASIIGHALVHTPILPVPLEGPVYFVSYGGAKFPDAVLDLSGYGVHIELHGNTFIDSKTGVTSATFKSLPDVPFESIEVTVSQGPYSEFGANLPHESYDFCGQRLTMPIFFKASNGVEIHQDTRVAVTGCPTKIQLTSHNTRGKTLMLGIYAPAAGKLVITGKGIPTTKKNAAAQEDLTLTIHTDHPGQKAKLKITFTPAHGNKQTATLTTRL